MRTFILFNVTLLITAAAIILLVLQLTNNTFLQKAVPQVFSPLPSPTPAPKLEFTSIDTMKYSRDASREVLEKPAFDLEIDTQVRNIAQTKATHVAISTPYDDEFLPVLKRWVKAARKYKLKVWFRGNFSGWENWFGYRRISRATHKGMMEQFILKNPQLFQNGDIFTPCPECENGGPGDPRQTGDVEGFRKFMIQEYELSQKAFRQIGKTVHSNMASMNYDVANLVMDRETTASMGGIVTVDHYVTDPLKLVNDLDILAQKTGGKVVLGEFGAPLPDLHGNMSEEEQAAWIETVLGKISQSYNVIGVNYWVNRGGSAAIWSDDNKPTMAVKTLSEVYRRYKP